MKLKIVDYENYYIYENGEVENISTHKILKGSISENGYKYYRLSKDNKKQMFYAHRLVALHFIPNKHNLPIVNHKDGNKLNNNVENLEWVTQSDNMFHAHEYNLISKSRPASFYEEDLKSEIWRSYLDYENYLISNFGRVRNIKTDRLLKPSVTGGYLKARLCKNGAVQDLLIHKLVYAVFNNEEYLNDRKMVIDHIDGNKINNNFNNLRKISNSENAFAALYEQKTNGSIKPVAQYSLDGELINTFSSCRVASRELKLDSSTISKVCRGKNKTHGGFIFKYL